MPRSTNHPQSDRNGVRGTPIHIIWGENFREIKQGGQRFYRVTVDTTSTDLQIPGDQNLDLSGYLYIGGLPASMFRDTVVTSNIRSRHGFLGCMASVDLNGQSPDLFSYTSDQSSMMRACTGKDFADLIYKLPSNPFFREKRSR